MPREQALVVALNPLKTSPSKPPHPIQQDFSGTFVHAPFGDGRFFGKVIGQSSTHKRKWDVGFFDENNEDQSIVEMNTTQILKWQQKPDTEVEALWDKWK